jgi:hypothetical protein
VPNLVVGGGDDEARPCLRFNALVGLVVIIVPTVSTPEIGRASKSIPIQLVVVFDGDEDDIIATAFLK